MNGCDSSPSAAELGRPADMKMDNERTDTILQTARAIMKAEHDLFVKELLDNDDHIARVRQIADAVGKYLQSEDVGKADARATVDTIVDYGRQLFLDCTY